MNNVVLIGRLTRDPEVRYGDTTIARFTLAVDRRYKKEGQQNADFISCISFAKTAEFVDKYFHKGSRLAGTGRIQTGSYVNKEGQKIYTSDVVIEQVEFIDKMTDAPVKSERSDDFIDVPDDVQEELPFA